MMNRRRFLNATAAAAAAATGAAAKPKDVGAARASGSGRMPVLFVGHGSPMNAIEDNVWSQGFRALADLLPRPKAVLAVSAHWYVPGTHLTQNDRPETIHDFGGFPDELYAVQYPAVGDPALAERVVRLLGPSRASLRKDWGLDHGTWTVLRTLRPQADWPVVQLSIDQRLTPEQHLEIGRALAPLREEGVLIFGSGNVTHNLGHAMMSYARRETEPPDWALLFDGDVATALEQHDSAHLAKAVGDDNGRMAHPSPDHYLPLLYCAGAMGAGDSVAFPITGFDLTSISMRAVLIG